MYSKLTHSWLKHWDFILLDLCCLELSFLLAYVIRHGIGNVFVESLFRSEAVLLFVSQLLAIFFIHSFSGVMKRGYYLEFVNTVKHVAVVMTIALIILFIEKETGTYSRITFVITSVFYVMSSWSSRMLLKCVVKYRALKKDPYSLVIITAEEMAEDALKKLLEESYQRYVIKGICLLDSKKGLSQIQGYPVIDGEEALIEYACHEWVDEALFLLPTGIIPPQRLQDALNVMGIATHVPIPMKNIKGSKQFIEKLGGYTVLTTSMNIVATREAFYKRILDITGGIVGCLMTLVFMFIVGPMIYFKSPGPIFFSQTRIGKNGRKFKMYKFRSMYIDAEERKKELMKHNKMDGLMFKMDHDPRIIGSEKIGKDGKPKGIGNFIRATSIDEFPQFWNVLKGDMSLVGTRPPTLDEWEQYEPHHRARMAIKPGITGMWQVSGRSDITDFEEVVRLDTEYIEKWNLGLDIKILFTTVLKVLKNDGAM